MTDLPRVSRRRVLQLLSGASVGSLAGCSTDSLPDLDGNPSAGTARQPPPDPADTTTSLTAAPGTVQPSANASAENWLYNGQFPGPELRLEEGEVFEAELTNDLPAGTTIHWHGVPVPNGMDGVPNVTQEPVAPGGSFTYKYRAEPPGTYFFHSHVGLQLDRGLLAPLIIEEDDPHVDYDREVTVVVDDYLEGEPQPLSELAQGGTAGTPIGPGGQGGGPGAGGGPGGGRRGPGGGPGGPTGPGPGTGPGGGPGQGGGPGGLFFGRRPPYAGLLVNGQLPDNPRTFTVSEGERVRFRFVNASSATAFRVGAAGHPLTVTHADGRPVEPVTVDSVVFGSGERYDAIVEANNSGTWEIRATAVDGSERPARAILAYGGVDTPASPASPSAGGQVLSYGALRAVSPLEGLDGPPDRTFDLTLSAARGGTQWLIDGQSYPDADPLTVQQGEHVRIRMVNLSPVLHPMHLHGHFFRVGDAVKDTVIVPAHMGRVTIDFLADNPGDWLFHCHNLYHLESGMARVIRYR
ncbi:MULTISPECIES: multicopper oxidase family protein [Salinibaculum]|uniref:multicopper oxidase family protein n=1 Tax=Salinibaculum TaxID=2732368 RepID=UPI0030D61D18